MAIPDYRALGEARLKIAAEINSLEEWQEKWPEPEHGFPWKWGTCWKHMASYRVADFAAEAGFFIDILGMPVNAFGPDFMMVTGPEKGFYLGVFTRIKIDSESGQAIIVGVRRKGLNR